MKSFSTIKGVSVAALLTVAVLGASAASAKTVTYDTFVTGDNLGGGVQATLNYMQNGNDVDFSLMNSLNSIATAFISSIGFTYGGSVPTSISNLAGSQANVTGLGNGSSLVVPGEGLSIDFAALFTNNNSGGGANRLVVGETALFRIANVQASLFDFSSFKTGIRAQGLANGGSTKYTIGDDDGGVGGPPVVPLPASFPMLLSALGLGVFLRKRRANRLA